MSFDTTDSPNAAVAANALANANNPAQADDDNEAGVQALMQGNDSDAGVDELGAIPRAGAPPAPTFSQLLAKHADALATGNMRQPGQWARALVGAAQTALGGVANIGKVPAGAPGALYGIGKVLQFQQQQRQQAQQQARENAREDSKTQSENAEHDARTRLIEANIQNLHNTRMAHQLSDQDAALDSRISADAPAFGALTAKDNEHPAEVIARDIDSKQLQKMLADKNHPLNSYNSHVFMTGKKPIYDADGNKTGTEGIYTVLGASPKVNVDDAEANYLSKYTDDKWAPGTSLPSEQYYLAHQRALAVDTTLQHLNEDRAQQNLPPLNPSDIQSKKDLLPIGEALRVANYDPQLAKTYLDKKDPDAATQLMGLYGGTKAWNAMVAANTTPKAEKYEIHNLEEANAALAEAHNNLTANPNDPAAKQKVQDTLNIRNAIQQGQLDFEKQKKNLGTEAGSNSNLTGDDYLKTLPAGRAASIKAFGEGRQELTARIAKEYSDDLNQAYPDWDQSKGLNWFKSRNEYMGSGATAKKVVSYNTALEHMQDLFDHTTTEGVFNPLSKDYQDRQTAMTYVSNEVGNAIKNGVMSESEGKQILDGLTGGLTPGLKRERVAETSRLLHDKIEEYQNKFNDAAPSSAVHVPTLMSPKAANSYDYIQSGGKSQQQAAQQTPKYPNVQIPQGWQWTMKDGRMGITDGSQFKPYQGAGNGQ